MSGFFDRNKDNLAEDGRAREKAGQLPTQYDGCKWLNSYAEIAKNKAAGAGTAASTPKKAKPKRSKEVKISVDGFTVSVKTRRLLTDELVAQALRKAIVKVEPGSQKKAR